MVKLVQQFVISNSCMFAFLSESLQSRSGPILSDATARRNYLNQLVETLLQSIAQRGVSVELVRHFNSNSGQRDHVIFSYCNKSTVVA